MLSPNYYDIYAPFGCGYTIKHEYKTDEEMALSILSQDDSFDLFLMDSDQEISSNIRDKGSFYPLNNVKGVKEYLNACFPYIKDSAADADGNIWMLPIAINIPCLFYNESKCREYGIEFNNSMNLDNLIQIITKVKQDAQAEQLYYYTSMNFLNSLMYQYTRTYTDLNNQLFRDLAGTLKADFNYLTHPSYGNDMLPYNLSFQKDNNFLFFYNNDHEYQYNVTDIDGVRACELPSITDNQTNTATCIYLCVNPASKNLKTTLQYISSICSYLLTLDETLMFSDRDIYKDGKLVDDLYAIYANGEIQFTYPNELFNDDLEKYLTDEKDLESVIKDSNRRLEIFLNE